jgi:hypothetical protein
MNKKQTLVTAGFVVVEIVGMWVVTRSNRSLGKEIRMLREHDRKMAKTARRQARKQEKQIAKSEKV